MVKLKIFLSAIFISFLFIPLTAFSQGKVKPVQPDSSAEQILSKPDQTKGKKEQTKMSSDKLVEIINDALKQQEALKKKAPTESQKKEQSKAERSLGYEIDGLLIDETLTKVGHDFYDIFYKGWEAPEKVINYTIKIKEKPALGRGFIIAVLVNDETIMEQSLQPSYSMIEEVALYGIAYTADYLLNFEKLNKQLESDDQKSTELY